MTERVALWQKISKDGKTYFTGKDQFGHRWFLFPVTSDNPNAPNFRLCNDIGEASKQVASQTRTLAASSDTEEVYS